MNIDSPIIHWAIYSVIGTAILVLISVGMLAFRVLPRLTRIIDELNRLSENTRK